MPYGIDVDEKFIYIGDWGNCRIQVFHLNNCTYSHQWGSKGSGDWQFTFPREVRVAEGLCYVGDRYGIQIFKKENGQFCYRLGKNTTGSGEGEFNLVVGILIINGCLYVSDYKNNRLVVLQ